MQANSPKSLSSFKTVSLTLAIAAIGLLVYLIAQGLITLRTAIIYFYLAAWFYYAVYKLGDISCKFFALQNNPPEVSQEKHTDVPKLLRSLKLHAASLTLAIGNLLSEIPMSDELKARRETALSYLIVILLALGIWAFISPTQKQKKPEQ